MFETEGKKQENSLMYSFRFGSFPIFDTIRELVKRKVYESNSHDENENVAVAEVNLEL